LVGAFTAGLLNITAGSFAPVSRGSHRHKWPLWLESDSQIRRISALMPSSAASHAEVVAQAVDLLISNGNVAGRGRERAEAVTGEWLAALTARWLRERIADQFRRYGTDTAALMAGQVRKGAQNWLVDVHGYPHVRSLHRMH
jgi:hypothetical protein